MFFHIDVDDGRCVSGWLAPDNPAATPRLIVSIPGRENVEFEATIPRADVRDLGIHSTGHVGFCLDDTIIPGIEKAEELQIYEAETRLPVHGRFQPGRHVERKVILFDASVMPQRRMFANIRQFFSLNYLASERYSLETMIVIINNHAAKSVFISGRSNFNRYSGYLENADYIVSALLRDPFEELAERLIFLNLLAKSSAAHLASNFVTGVAPLVDLARELPLQDPKSLLPAFRRLSEDQRAAISNPAVKMFGCTLGDPPERRHVSIALDNLATMDVVGTRTRFGAFRSILQRLVGADFLGEEEPMSFDSVQALAYNLSRIGIVTDLLEYDAMLYRLADDAINIGLEGREDEVARDTQSM